MPRKVNRKQSSSRKIFTARKSFLPVSLNFFSKVSHSLKNLNASADKNVLRRSLCSEVIPTLRSATINSDGLKNSLPSSKIVLKFPICLIRIAPTNKITVAMIECMNSATLEIILCSVLR